MLTKIYEPRYGDYKNYESLKEDTLLDIIQDIAIQDSRQAGFGLIKLRSMNVAWLLQGINVRFVKNINPALPIEVFTAVKAMGAATSERGCLVYQNGEIVAKSIANWFTFNTERGKLCKIPPEMLNVYELHDFDDPFFSYKKLPPEACTNEIGTITVEKSHIDTNCHLNNRMGAVILMDQLPVDFTFNNLSITYKKSAYLGDELKVYRQETQNGFRVQLQNCDGQLCIAGIFENTEE